jgi:hypothetical protein
LDAIGERPDMHLDVAISPDNRNFAEQDTSNGVSIMEIITGAERTRIAHGELVSAMAFSPNGRELVTRLGSGPLCVWDLPTNRLVCRLGADLGIGRSFAYSADGKILASGNENGSILLWDAARFSESHNPPVRELSAVEVKKEWDALGGTDGKRAFQALWALRAVPEKTMPLLKEHLRPAAAVSRERIAKLIADLDCDVFDKREEATAELRRIGAAAEEPLRAALKANASVELHRRTRRLLATWQGFPPSPERLRTLRMLELIERTGSTEAKKLLSTLAANESDPWMACEAAACRDRLHRPDLAKPSP